MDVDFLDGRLGRIKLKETSIGSTTQTNSKSARSDRRKWMANISEACWIRQIHDSYQLSRKQVANSTQTITEGQTGAPPPHLLTVDTKKKMKLERYIDHFDYWTNLLHYHLIARQHQILSSKKLHQQSTRSEKQLTRNIETSGAVNIL